MYEVQINSECGPDLSFEAEDLAEAQEVGRRESGPGDYVRILDEAGREVEVFERRRPRVGGIEPCVKVKTEGPTGVAGFLSGRYA